MKKKKSEVKLGKGRDRVGLAPGAVTFLLPGEKKGIFLSTDLRAPPKNKEQRCPSQRGDEVYEGEKMHGRKDLILHDEGLQKKKKRKVKIPAIARRKNTTTIRSKGEMTVQENPGGSKTVPGFCLSFIIFIIGGGPVVKTP